MLRLVIVLPLTPLRTGDSFAVAHWPLHITVLPPFLARAAPAEIADAIGAVARDLAPIVAIAGPDALFGRRHDVPVTLVEESERLHDLRQALVDAVRPLAGNPKDRAFTGPDFRPHITAKHGRRVREGERLSLTQIALVDMVPRAASSGRTVLATADLGASPPAPGG